MEVEGVAAVTLDFLPLDARAKHLSRSYQFDWNGLLAGTNENDDVCVVAQARKIHLLYVLEINEQKFLSQRYLAWTELDAINGLALELTGVYARSRSALVMSPVLMIYPIKSS